MNVFDAIYFNETDPVKRAFIAAETALDIAVSQALKDFEFESGLVELCNDSVFSEAGNAGDNAKKENIFVRAIKGIFSAIGSFFTSIIDAITGIFDKREPVTGDDYVKSDKGRKQLENDINNLDKAVDKEVLKGKKLLQQASSATGIPDTEIDAWVRSGVEKVKAAAPTAIPIIAALGVNKLVSFLRKNKDASGECEKMALAGSGKLTSEQQKQKSKIAKGFHTIFKAAASPIMKIVEGRHKVADDKYMADRRKQHATYSAIEADYMANRISDDEYMRELRSLSTIDREIEKEFERREEEKRIKRECDKAVRALCDKAIRKIRNDQKDGVITKDNAEARCKFVDRVRETYISGKGDANAYHTAVNGLKNHILNR